MAKTVDLDATIRRRFYSGNLCVVICLFWCRERCTSPSMARSRVLGYAEPVSASVAIGRVGSKPLHVSKQDQNRVVIAIPLPNKDQNRSRAPCFRIPITWPSSIDTHARTHARRFQTLNRTKKHPSPRPPPHAAVVFSSARFPSHPAFAIPTHPQHSGAPYPARDKTAWLSLLRKRPLYYRRNRLLVLRAARESSRWQKRKTRLSDSGSRPFSASRYTRCCR